MRKIDMSASPIITSATEAHPPPPILTHSPGAATDRAGLAHDVRNLLGALSLYCDLLGLPGVLHPQYTHYAHELCLLGDRSLVMIERLLAYQPTPESCERPGACLPDTLEQCRGLLTALAGSGVMLEVECAPAAFEVNIPIPTESLERILINLVRNAAAAMANPLQAASLRIAVQPAPLGSEAHPPRGLILTVHDTGCGMDAATLDRLLHPVNQPCTLAHDACLSIRDSGMSAHGIGINVVRDLVELSGGALRIASTPGAGTTVEIEWPAIPPPDSTPLRATMTHSAPRLNGQQPDPGHSSSTPRPHSMQVTGNGAKGPVLC